MTDLPQLQTNLVDAATRRRRRRRVRRVTTRVAVAATLLVAFPLLAREIAAPDPEVTAPTPTPTGHGRPAEDGRGGVRRVPPARDRARHAALARGGRRGALHRWPEGPPGVPGQARRGAVPGRPQRARSRWCATRRARSSPAMRCWCGPAANLLTVALPDAVKTVRITTPGSKPFTLEAADALAVTLGAGSGRLEWTAPDGTPRADHIYWGDAATQLGALLGRRAAGRPPRRPARRAPDRLRPQGGRVARPAPRRGLPRRPRGRGSEQRLPAKPRRHALPDRRLGGAPDRGRRSRTACGPCRSSRLPDTASRPTRC